MELVNSIDQDMSRNERRALDRIKLNQLMIINHE